MAEAKKAEVKKAEAKKAEAKAPKKIDAYKQPAKFCSKCGARMGDHKDRFACGKCGYTEWKQSKPNAGQANKGGA